MVSFNASLAGLASASQRFEKAATNIANQNIPLTNGEDNAALKAPQKDITDDMVDLQVAKNDYKANLTAIKVANNIEQSLLDIFA